LAPKFDAISLATTIRDFVAGGNVAGRREIYRDRDGNPL